MLRSQILRFSTASLLFASLVPPADAGCARGRLARRQARATVSRATTPPTASCASPAARPMQAMPSGQVSAPVPQAATGDPGTFLNWLNAYRASRGVGPASYDPALSVDAAASNAAMRARGVLAHYWNIAPASKNVGSGPMGTIQAMWAGSPAHDLWLLRATSVGIAYDGTFATMSAR